MSRSIVYIKNIHWSIAECYNTFVNE